jgi:hypothetical protein
MPLTRSLYREDEVIAALKWCVIKGRFNQALFWAQEALDSNMKTEYFKALLWVWIFTCGPSTLSWIERFDACMGDSNEYNCLNLVISLLYHVKNRGDISALCLLGRGLCRAKKQPNTITLLTLPEGLPNTPIIRALIQGKTDLAWMLLRPDWTTTSWANLKTVIQQKNPQTTKYLDMLSNPKTWMGLAYTPEWTWCLRSIATVLACSLVPFTVHDDTQNFDRVMSDYICHTGFSMRHRRVYEVPNECLYWHTKRGALSINETTVNELQLNLEDSLAGSKYWDEYLPIGYDIEREEFFYLHFPDDIPDEWSAETKKKSHGHGPVPVGAVNHNIVFNRCLIRWFNKLPCIHLWRGFEIAIEEFTQRWEVYRPQSLETGIHEAYEEIDVDSWLHEMESWSLNSKRPQFVVRSN